jgi:glycosyltransferase involved in cell wall biosynthesis
VDTPDDWYNAFSLLIRDPALRLRVGKTAYTNVVRRYNVTDMSRNIASILNIVRTPNFSSSRRKRILVVNVWYPPQSIGGAARVVHDNVTDLIHRYGDEFEIEVFTTTEGDPVPYRMRSFSHEGVRVTAISAPSDGSGDMKAFDANMESAFRRFLSFNKPDLVHFHGVLRLSASMPLAAKAMSIPYVITLHDGWWISDLQFLVNEVGQIEIYSPSELRNKRLYGDLSAERAKGLREVLLGARKVVAVSESFAEIHRAAGFSDVIAISNGVSPIPQGARTRSVDGRVRVGFIGGMAFHKGYSLIEVTIRGGSYSNLSLLIVDHSKGSGFERHEVWGRTLVTFIGRCSQNEVGGLYGSLDVLLAPSIWPESCCLVTREALHCGLWVVASDRGAAGEYVVHEKNGYLIDVSDTRGLQQALGTINNTPEKFLIPPDERPQLRHSFEQADDLAKLYRELLAEVSRA